MKPLHLTPPLVPAAQASLLAVLGILSRPVLSDALQAQLKQLVASPDWNPVPFPPSVDLLGLLFRHHLERMGMHWRQVFTQGALEMRRLEWEKAVVADIRRRGILHALLERMAEAGIGRVMLIKGAALAPLYPSPALRLMSDIDFAVAKRDLPAVERILAALGCRPHRFEGAKIWRHSSGLLMDIHVPANEWSRKVFHRAESHPCFPGLNGACHPRPADHLLLLALHAARNAGLRLWRDVCDAQLLLPGIPDAERSALAELLADLPAETAPAAAFFRFLNSYASPPFPLPERKPGAWNRLQERDCAVFVRLYRALAVETNSPGMLNLLRFSLQSPRELSRMLWRRTRDFLGRSDKKRGKEQKQHLSQIAWRERDPVLGDLAPRGSWARQLLKGRLVVELIASGRFRRYLRLFRMQRKLFLQAPKPFDTQS